MITQRDFMQHNFLLKQKIGLRLSRTGLLSKILAIQAFTRETLEITPEQFNVLNTLKENNGIYLRQLASITLKDRPNITRIVSILEKKGFLTSAKDKEKRMVKKLYITKKGIEMCNIAIPTILKAWNEIVSELQDEEIKNFLITLEKIETKLLDRVVMQN